MFYSPRHYEYPVPKHMNKRWNQRHFFYRRGDRDVEEFLLKYAEKKSGLERRRKR